MKAPDAFHLVTVTLGADVGDPGRWRAECLCGYAGDARDTLGAAQADADAHRKAARDQPAESAL